MNLKPFIGVTICAALFWSVGSGHAAETLIQRVLRFWGISATPAQLRDPIKTPRAGEILIYDRGTRNTTTIKSPVTLGYPIFLPNNERLLALKGKMLVEISVTDGSVKELFPIEGVQKIVGVDRESADTVLILTGMDSGKPQLASASVSTGTIEPIPYGDTDIEKQLIAHLANDERVYNGMVVTSKSETRAGVAGPLTWTEIYVQEAPKSSLVKISNCNGVKCSQPAMSFDRMRIAYVKERAL